MESNAIVEVYNNLVIMLTEFRKVVLDTTPLSPDEVVKKINHFEYIMISGKRTGDPLRPNSLTCVFLIAPGSKYDHKSPDFVKMLKQAPVDQTLTEIMVVTAAQLTTHIKKQIVELSKPNYIIDDREYELFEAVIPRHVHVPKHEIVSKEEGEKWCNERYTDMTYFPKILSTDSISVWLGIRPGMFVKIYRRSETAANAIAYRYCNR